MLELISKAWQDNKGKFLLVAIPVAILLLASLVMKGWRSYLISSAKKLLEKAVAKDKQLSVEAEKTDQEANDHKAKADELGKKADAIEDDADWNKKV
jgi:hypothetical protein